MASRSTRSARAPAATRRDAATGFAGGFGPVVDGVTLPQHPFDPTAPAISRDKPLIVGWNEDEYNFFAWQRQDTSGYGVDLAGLRAKLAPRFGADTARIVDTYRKSRPSASPTDIFVAVNRSR